VIGCVLQAPELKEKVDASIILSQGAEPTEGFVCVKTHRKYIDDNNTPAARMPAFAASSFAL
jgi:hypothetical protein